MPDCPHYGSGREETAIHTFYYCERVRPKATSGSIQPASSPRSSCCSTLVTSWTMLTLRIKVRNVRCFSWSHQYLEWWFGRRESRNCMTVQIFVIVIWFYSLWVKIRCDRKRLDHITFDERWVNVASLVVRKGAMLDSSFPLHPTYGDVGPGLSEPHPSK